MLLLFLQAICISLCGYSIGLIYWELKTKFDKSFLYFGITIILLCLFCAIDLWKQPFSFNLKWTNLQHVISCLVTPFFIKYLHTLIKKDDIVFQKILFIISGIISILFVLNLMFIVNDNNATPNLIYALLFVPYTLFTAFYINYHVVKTFLNSSGFERKIYFSHILGFALITICGLLDFIRLLNNQFVVPVVSFTIFGVIGLGVLLSYIFTERLILLIQERNRTLQDLKLAYTELEDARSLSELGQSSAMINHEIRNHISAIKGYLELIKLKIGKPEIAENWISKAILSIDNLTKFSVGILDFSKSKILKEKKPLDICSRISNTICEHFPDHKEKFKMINIDNPVMIHGDWVKLNHVFLNLFKNSIEAEATEINIRILLKERVILLTIEDNGCGLDPEKIGNIFKAFHSTKGSGGTGLGMSIARSIIEGHGGHINAATKNQSDIDEKGMIFNISFPVYFESGEKQILKNSNIVLIKENLSQLSEILKMFQNVFVVPAIMQDLNELFTDKKLKDDIVVLGSSEIIGSLNRKSNKCRCFSIVSNSNGRYYVAGNSNDAFNGIFNEEFILKCLPVI